MHNTKWSITAIAFFAIGLLLITAPAFAATATPWSENTTLAPTKLSQGNSVSGASARPAFDGAVAPATVDAEAALILAAEYLRKMQADVTEDNAGNGSGALESPDDPDDGGWDWVVTSPPAPFSHTTVASPKNLYGVTALGLYYAYLETSDASYFTAMTDAATYMIADPDIRSATDLEFLMLYNDLPGVIGTAYRDAAKAKFDGRITFYGSATALAVFIRDVRGVTQNYPNGIIGWDIGKWVVAAQMLEDRYPADAYDYAQAADDMAEVLWQDSFNDNPMLFDVVDDAGFDPTYANRNYWWYNLGISGLIEAFVASNTHMSEVPWLVGQLTNSQHASGAIGFSYGVNAGDDDWQSTAYAAVALAVVNRPLYQNRISRMGKYLVQTQDVSGAWKSSNNNHYPSIAGECATALAFSQAEMTFSPSSIIYHCSGDFTFDVGIGAGVGDLEGAQVVIEYPADLILSSVTAADANFFLFTSLVDNGSGTDVLTVDLAVLTGAASGPAALFTVALNGAVNICSGAPISMTSVVLRDSDNEPIVADLAAAITLVADCADPDVVVNSPASGGFYNVAPVLDISASDNCDLDAVYYQIDGCSGAGWIAIASGLSGTAYNNPAWTLPGFAGLSEANHCVYFKVVDANGRKNSDTCTYFWCFTKDVTAPPPPTGLMAAPGHNKVRLSWTNSPTDFDHTVVMRTDWYAGGHGYPEYDDDNPEGAYPPDIMTGDMVYSGTGVAHTDTDDLSNSTRDVYHYAAFTVDAAGNVSAPSVGARSTSYWLGDVASAYNGNVYFEDLSVLSVTYGLSHGEMGYNNEFDIGPTHNNSPKGIPTTDNSVDFEDLVIFAINFDAVNPTMKMSPIFADRPVDGPLGLGVTVEELDADELVVHVTLQNNPNTVKSIHFVMPAASHGLELMESRLSDALAASAMPVFFKAREVGGRIDVSVALLGGETAIGGSGELVTLRLKRSSTGTAAVMYDEIDMRDGQNNRLHAVGQPADVGSGSPLPATYELAQNYPNPFNAGTVISYQVPSAGDVSIVVYNLTGQVVKTLVQGHRDQGRYSTTWDGTDSEGHRVSSGVYLYRILAGEHRSSRKMVLMK